MLPNPTDASQPVTYERVRDHKRVDPDQLRYAFSVVLIIVGVGLLLTQLVPLGASFAYGLLLSKNTETQYSPLPGTLLSEIMTPKYYDPGVSYFQNLLAQNNATVTDAGGGSVLGASTATKIDTDYHKAMYLEIPKLKISKLKVSPNVDSFNKTEYNKALQSGVAHFRGTPLPGDGGNSFIYGHSGLGNLWQVNKAQLIFSRLEKLNIGDSVIISKDGQEYKYVAIKKQIIEESNLKVLETVPGKETVTLMTCWPLGIGAQRLIVVAEKQ